MKYTITGQISVSPLNSNFRECKENTADAKYQAEIYKARETRNRICMIQPFNNNQFTHAVNSTVHFVPGHIVNDIMLPANMDCKKIQR